MVDMKKIFLIIGLVLICVGVGFGSAVGEQHSFTVVESQAIANTDVLKYTYVFKPEGYAFEMEFEMTNQGGYLLLRRNGQYFDLISEDNFSLAGAKENAAEALFSAYASDNQNFSIELIDLNDHLENVKGNTTDINLSELEPNLQLFNITEERLNFLMETLQDWENQELLFFIENGDNDKCIYLSFKVKHGFFAQELDYLNALQNSDNQTYETKALSLMYLSMGPMQNEFISTIQKYEHLFNDNTININFIQNAVFADGFPIGNLRAYLQLGFVNYFNYTLNKKSTVLNSNDYFKMKFYDKEKRSPYALAYSLFSYDLNKPILSSLNFTDTNWNISINSDNSFETNSSAITESQADLIVQNAMYYYNWALEYSLGPLTEANSGITENEQNIVFINTFDSATVDNKGTELKEPYYSWMSQKFKPYEFESSATNFLIFPNNSSSVPETGALLPFNANDEFDQYLNITQFDVFNNELLKTVFKDRNNQPVFGNPVPYLNGGIDSPRTFNKKMYEQWLSNNEIFNSNNLNYTTRAIPEILRKQNIITSSNFINYDDFSSYNSNSEITDHLPFKPGISKDKNNPDVGKFAGVDSIGFLLGTVSMSGLEIFDKNAMDKADVINTYFSFLNGYPEYNENNYNDKRIDIYDLENQSVLVPDLSLMRKGDFLIDPSNIDDPHIGIILKTNSLAFSLNETYVLSIGRAHRIMTLGKWLNTNTIYNSFTTNPRKYQIRRLIQYSSNSINNAIPVWDLIQFPKNYVMDIKKIEGTHVMSHWIPNTKIDDPNSDAPGDVIYEPLMFDKIEIYNKIGRKTLPLKMGSKIAVMPPKDMYWDDEPDDIASPAANNIFKNKGSGIELVALRKDNQGNDIIITVAKFVINGNADSPLSAYEISNVDTDLVDGNGNMIEGYSLITEGITLKLKDQNDNAFIQFGVRINDESYRPGDDFLLRFKVVETETDITAAKNDFVTVYDKKFLWRAHLYIDETKNEDGTPSQRLDWNNINPIMNFDENQWAVLESDGAYINGGQFPILPWTRFAFTSSPLRSKAGEVHDSLPYDTGGKDSPHDFNFTINEQRKALNLNCSPNGYKYNIQIDDWQIITSENLYEYTFSSSKWSQYYPELVSMDPLLSSWIQNNNTIQNQVNISNTWRLNYETNGYNNSFAPNITISDPPKEGLENNFWYNYIKDSYLPSYRYLRLFSEWYGKESTNTTIADFFGSSYSSSNVKGRSIGLDCAGFIGRAASYIDNNYLKKYTDAISTNLGIGGLDDNHRDTISDYDSSWPYIVRIKIAGGSRPWNMNSALKFGYLIEEIDFNKIIPGDVIYEVGHIAIIYNVEYDDDNNIKLAEIRFLEASCWDNENKVQMDKNYTDHVNNTNVIGIFRLKTE